MNLKNINQVYFCNLKKKYLTEKLNNFTSFSIKQIKQS